MKLWQKLKQLSFAERMGILFISCSMITLLTIMIAKGKEISVYLDEHTFSEKKKFIGDRPQYKRRPRYKRSYFTFYKDEVKLDQLLVLDQILLTLKEINTKLSAIPSILDLTHPADTDQELTFRHISKRLDSKLVHNLFC